MDEDQVPTPKKTVKFQVDGVKFLLATNSSCFNDFLKISRWVKSLKKNDQKQVFFLNFMNVPGFPGGMLQRLSDLEFKKGQKDLNRNSFIIRFVYTWKIEFSILTWSFCVRNIPPIALHFI